MKILGFEFNFGSRSSGWAKLRSQHISKNPFCAACGRSDRFGVHRIESVHLNPNRELDPENLITLCSSPCYIVFGHFMDYKSWNINVIKDCEVYYSKHRNRLYK
jgi:hypothetical protein